MKKGLPLLLGFLAGAFALSEMYVPAHGWHQVHEFLLNMAQCLAAAAFILGGLNVVQINLPAISRRRPDWQYKVVLVGAALVMALVGIRWHAFGGEESPGTISIEPAAPGTPAAAPAAVIVKSPNPRYVVTVGGQVINGTRQGVAVTLPPGEHSILVRSPETGYTDFSGVFTAKPGETIRVDARIRMRWGPEGRPFLWIYDHLFAPANATMFALLAFFIASAAFRAFRARNVEATLLLGAAILVMIGAVPIGRAIWSGFPDIKTWILEYANTAGRRAIIIGAALGAIATSLRVILGLERSHLGRD